PLNTGAPAERHTTCRREPALKQTTRTGKKRKKALCRSGRRPAATPAPKRDPVEGATSFPPPAWPRSRQRRRNGAQQATRRWNGTQTPISCGENRPDRRISAGAAGLVQNFRSTKKGWPDTRPEPSSCPTSVGCG